MPKILPFSAVQKALNFFARVATGPGLPAIPAETMCPGQRCQIGGSLRTGCRAAGGGHSLGSTRVGSTSLLGCNPTSIVTARIYWHMTRRIFNATFWATRHGEKNKIKYSPSR